MATFIGSRKLSSSEEKSYKAAVKSGSSGIQAIKASKTHTQTTSSRPTLGSMDVTGEDVARALETGEPIQIKEKGREITGRVSAGSLGISGEDIAKEYDRTGGRVSNEFIENRVIGISPTPSRTLGPTTAALKEAQVKQGSTSQLRPEELATLKKSQIQQPRATILPGKKVTKSQQFKAGFKEGFTLDNFGTTRVEEEYLTPSRVLGRTAGGVALAATFLPLEGYQLTKTAGTKVVNAAKTTKIGEILIKGKTTAKATKVKAADKLLETFPNIGSVINKYPRSSAVVGSLALSETITRGERLLEDKETRKITDIALQESRTNIQETGGIGIPGTTKQVSTRSIINDITLFGGGESRLGLSSSKKEFIASVEEQTKGLPESERKQILNKALKARAQRGVAEIGGFVGISGIIERTGRNIFAQRLVGKTIPKEKVTFELFTKGFGVVAPLGIIEGAAQERFQQDIRGRERNFSDIAYMGGFGGLSAGIIGGGIVGLAPLNPAKSKALLYTSYIADPYELAGDKAATLFGKAKGRVTGRYDIDTIINVPKGPGTVTFTAQTTGKKKGSVAKPRSGIFTPSNILINTFTPEGGIFIPSDTLSENPSKPKPAPSVPTDPITGTPINTPTDIFTNVFGGTNTNTQTETITNTFTPVTNINIPVATPIMRIPPPIIPSLGLGSGQGLGTSNLLNRTVVNELSIGTALLTSLTATNGRSQSKPKSYIASRKKTKKQPVKQSRQQGQLNKIGKDLLKAVWG